MRAKKQFLFWAFPVLLLLPVIAYFVFTVDPFFHYRAPDTDRYYYPLNNERSQNDGILRHFDYDALITGTSMTMNFKTSEADSVFGVHSVKVALPGSHFYEVNEMLRRALRYRPDLKLIIRGLDAGYLEILSESSSRNLRYLYNNNPLDDINYLLNRDLFFGRALPMALARAEGTAEPGITSFDDYSHWELPSGPNAATVDGIHIVPAGTPVHMSEADADAVRRNITRNVASLAAEHPDTEFYYFFSPYSIIWWQSLVDDGTVYRQVEMEELACSILLEYDNIHLFSFSGRTDITTDLNNYGDPIHYCHWINSLILRWMKDDAYRLTPDNYQDYLRQELDFYTGFDYSSLIEQQDYEDDLYAAEILQPETLGLTPHPDLWEGAV